jgi:hypothetical protein
MKRVAPLLALVALCGCGGATTPKATTKPAHHELTFSTPTAPASTAAPAPPSPSPSPTHIAPSPSPKHVTAIKPPPHPVSAPHHQNVIIAGDSIPEDLGPMITRQLNGPLFSGHTESHPITGLVRNDYYDWPAQAARIAAEHPDTVIMLIGGNDNQPIHLPSGAIAQPATPAWDAEYARRAGLVMDAFTRGGVHRVYWLTMPTTDLPSMNGTVAAMGQALHTAAKSRPAVTIYNTDVLLGKNAGTPAAHQPDGIHLSILGSTMISNALIGRLRIDASSAA